MSKRSDAYLRGVPMKPYDLLREGLIVLAIIALIILVLAIVFSSPDYPTVRGEDVAQRQPIAYLRTSINYLTGESGIEAYGPPYTHDKSAAQDIFGVAPANWFGVTIPLDPAQDFVIAPLERVAVLRPDVADALQTYKGASTDQQQLWATAYASALDNATISNGEVQLPEGDYGPVAVMMTGMLDLGRAGLLEGALESSDRLPYSLDYTKSLLFFQDDVDASVASDLVMTGDQWGISHETGNYPGAWWLWPYTIWYQFKPIADSPNADLEIGVIMGVIFLVLLLLPFIPVLNRLPHWLKLYRIIWRDWYKRRSPERSNSRAGP